MGNKVIKNKWEDKASWENIKKTLKNNNMRNDNKNKITELYVPFT